MKILCCHSVALGFTLCAAITSVTLTGQSAQAQETATKKSATTESAPPVSEMYDKDFAKHVDLRLLGIAWQTLDAKLMADVALQLREAESVLGRKHPKITSQQILKMTGKVAADSEDTETLERLARVAEASGDTTESSKMKQMQALAAQSRSLEGDLKDTPIFSANDVSKGALAAFGNILLQVRAAKVSGDRDTLVNLAEGTDLLSSLRDSHRSRLKGLIDEATETVGEPDKSLLAISMLTGSSRSIVSPPVTMVSPNPPMNGETPSGKTETSYAASGMKYVMTPGGAAVQSPGRIGSVVFAPGDVILAMSGYPLSIGTSIDSAIDYGYLNGDRSLSVRDGETGQVSNMSY